MSRADGVGPKLAARVVAELKDKAGGIALGPAKQPVKAGGGVVAASGGAAADAVSALVNLGFRQAEAYGAVAQVAQQLGPGSSVESLIQAGLRELSQ